MLTAMSDRAVAARALRDIGRCNTNGHGRHVHNHDTIADSCEMIDHVWQRRELDPMWIGEPCDPPSDLNHL